MGYYYSPEVDCAVVDELGKGTYPEVNSGRQTPLLTLMFNLDDMYPEYLPDVTVLVCPEDGDFTHDDFENPVTGEIDMYRHCSRSDRGLNLADSSYTYLSHFVDKCGGSDCSLPIADFSPVLQLYFADDVAAGASVPKVCGQLGAWFDWIVNAIETDPEGALATLDGDFDMAIDAPFDVLAACVGREFAGNLDRNTVYRLRENLVRDLLNGGAGQNLPPISPSNIPVMFDNAAFNPTNFNHSVEAPGCNVLYQDGHVEYFNHPGKPPVSESVIWLTQCIRSGSE